MPRPNQIPEHSRTEIASAGIALADAGGLGTVTMRNVAAAIGTGPSSLYRYVTNRAELLELMADQACGEVTFAGADLGEPAARLLAIAREGHALYLRHPWLLGIRRYSMSEGCVFCDQSWMRAAEIFFETPHCIFASTRDPDIRAQAGLAEGVLPGSGAIVPIAHRTSVFELTPAEWADTQDLLLQARMALHDLLAPDGYLLGWNQGGVLHPHMHVIPRFDDEPLSDRWLRSAINLPENRRPDPWAPGSGREFRGGG